MSARPLQAVRTPVSAALLIIPLSLVLLAAQANGQPAPPVQPHRAGHQPDLETRRGPSDPAELERFVDELMRASLAEENVAGATVAVVRDGELLLSKGYGWADVERRIPVDPATTLFRIGSVTKLFTWTAVMQLRDEGKLDLDADVVQHLDFRIPAAFPEPITLRHLMTHTSGFEYTNFGLFAPDVRTGRGEWLRQNVPARVRPPGQDLAYSNYAAALAAYIVERVSGMTWEEYIEERILRPLGIQHATGHQVLPDSLAARLSIGYVHRSGSFVAHPFDWISSPLAPTGAISASAEAMAPFMIAHLQGGRYGDTRILTDSSAREMQARAFGHDPRINGWTLGFAEMNSHDLRIIGHGGSKQRFFTALTLIPSERLGVFISYNTRGAAPLPDRFRTAFLDHYYPALHPLAPLAPAPGWDTRAKGYVGTYASLRRSYTTLQKLSGASRGVSVAAGSPGEILVRSGSGTERLFEVEAGYFQSADRSVSAVFREPRRGATHLYLSTSPTAALERLSFWQRVEAHRPLGMACLVLFASILVLVPVRFVLQGRVGGIAPLRGGERAFRWAALAFALLSIGSFVAVPTALSDGEGWATGAAEASIRRALTLPLLSLPFAAAVVVGAMLAFRRGYWSRWERIHYALVAAAVVVFLLQLHYWNLLGWRF
jgi:CubicO group peptidase (beta-lactamase class C family)